MTMTCSHPLRCYALLACWAIALNSQVATGQPTADRPVATGTVIGRVSNAGTDGIIGAQVFEVFQAERLLLDLKAQYAISQRYSVFLDVYNLTREWSFEQVFDAFGRENKLQAQGNGTVFHAGLRLRL